jgi:hypothetical protein
VLKPEALAAQQKKQQAVAFIAAQAERRLMAQHKSGVGYQTTDIDTYLGALNLSVTQKIAVKRTLERTGQTIEVVLASMNLAPLPPADRIEAAARDAKTLKVEASAAPNRMADRLNAALEGFGGLSTADRQRPVAALAG